jgi:hypothetical protein
LVACLRQAKDFVVGHCDRFANAVAQAAGLSFKPGSHPVQRYFCRSFAGCLTTNAIDHHENASFGIQVKAILVVGPQKARMSLTCTSECGCCTHPRASPSRPMTSAQENKERDKNNQTQKKENSRPVE